MEPAESAAALDHALVDRIAGERSEAAFRSLYQRHTPRLYQLALRLAAWREDEAAEILQDSWVRAARKLHEFRWESALSTWLAGFVVNRSREARRDRAGAHAPLAALDGDPRAPLPKAEAKIDLERAVATLPEGYRRVLILHDIEGYTHLEIGGLLGVEAGTSKSQLFEARRALRRALGAGQEKGAETR
jgi:RNA polymerase sigma-70 factor (ECF subfamily)